jgi:hypothetical protein
LIAVQVYILILILIVILFQSFGGSLLYHALVVLVITPILSISLFFWYRNKLDVQVHIVGEIFEKNSIIDGNVVLMNRTYCPIPFVILHFYLPSHLELDRPQKHILSLASKETKNLSFQYRVKKRGNCVIGIRKIVVSDMLSLISFNRAQKLDCQIFQKEITILPTLQCINTNSRILENKEKFLGGNEDSRERVHFLGSPGYELREFREGDSLQRINWKITAKTNTFMVRKDEPFASAKRDIVLNPNVSREYVNLAEGSVLKQWFQRIVGYDELRLKMIEDQTLESLLAVCYANIKIGNIVHLWIYEKENWHILHLADMGHIQDLQLKLAQYSFNRDRDSMKAAYCSFMEDNFEHGERRALQIFSSGIDASFIFELQKFYEANIELEIVVVMDHPLKSTKQMAHLARNIWVIQSQEDISVYF